MLSAMATVPALEIAMDSDTSFYWEGTKRDQLLVQRCTACGRLRHPPSPVCASCRSLDWTEVETSGDATLHSVALVHYPASPMQGAEYLICLVDLAEGVRVATNLRDCALADATIGMALVRIFEPIANGYQLPQFRPAS
jgi:uncharacterized protein